MSAPIRDTRPLLVELFTEELPPKALEKLGQAFADGIHGALAKLGLTDAAVAPQPFATPRRLAVRIAAVHAQAPDQVYAERLMPVKVGLTADGAASPALLKKLAAKGWESLTVDQLEREFDGRQDYLLARGTAPGARLADSLQDALESALAGLPIPKAMRYQLADGDTSVRFVRPAHGLVALFGADIVPVQTLGLTAGRHTYGHRFLCAAPLELSDADSYESVLAERGHVLASFDVRRDTIARALHQQATQQGATIGAGDEVDALLSEVTALVEWPQVYVGCFDEAFLEVPSECLILTMRLNQKYFPLFAPDTGALTPAFLIVSNMATPDPRHIVEGNERVVRPRLADAKFFYDTDRKQPLAARVDRLATIVYHNKLGTQLERVERVRFLARSIATSLGTATDLADRAALLAKADLGSLMVGEFPELQGVMGAYYARHDGEPPEVAEALLGQYRIRLDRPVQAAEIPSVALFIAERLETLVGMWSVGGAPTGERDPYGLRRAALGLISAFEQLAAGGLLAPGANGPVALDVLLNEAADTFGVGRVEAAVVQEVQTFIYERYRNQLTIQHDRAAVDAVIALSPPLHQVTARVRAVEQFSEMPAAASLAAANKRIGNLLKKAEGDIGNIDPGLLKEPAEHALAGMIETLQPRLAHQREQGDFTGSLTTLSSARDAVDGFFNDVMVMADDPAVRANRLALLASLHAQMNQVADISRLVTQ
ncbi:MAG: glycine--tRNA ligase subunit beta [Burkholderiaceae bacterium]|nr:glycine--tRNA ligase subunit beta [Burkholderiaceae bacterium]